MRGGSLTAPEAANLFYRFTVKCDRDRNAAIEKAARREGVSATTFVQSHFDRILDDAAEAEIAAEIVERTDEATFEERQAAEIAGLTVGALRVLRVVTAADDGTGRAEIGVGSIARATGFTEGSVRVLLSKLVAAGHMGRISKAGWRRCTIYRVKQVPA